MRKGTSVPKKEAGEGRKVASQKKKGEKSKPSSSASDPRSSPSGPHLANLGHVSDAAITWWLREGGNFGFMKPPPPETVAPRDSA